ncbi:MAG: hypothetical protein D6797_00470 [Bdellovibrio sp.]|nr:MAG: hypothetical protein D6797_00470 [Bdellovibrio sp.]
MIQEVFLAMNRPIRIFTVPLWIFRLGVRVLNLLPRYRSWNTAMAERMNQDLVFDHKEFSRDFNFQFKPFSLKEKNIS